MISLSRFGYRSVRAFHRTKNVPRTTFDAMANDKWWDVQKAVLKHKECPDDIRERFANDALWYKRLVAKCATVASPRFAAMIPTDPDKRVRDCADANHWIFRNKLKRLWSLIFRGEP